jgi:hypothetical protein
MTIRDRIRELRRVPASSLRPHPKNWRTHPPEQQAALRGALSEIGYAAALLARELPDGALELIDGHLRAETTPDMDVPVLVVDLDEREAEKLLALCDPLAALAGSNAAALAALAAGMETSDEALRALFDEMIAPDGGCEPEEQPPSVTIPELYQVVVECRDGAEQESLYDRLTSEGFRCRVMSL